MLAATKVKMSGSKKKRTGKNIQHLTRKCLKDSRCSCAKQRQRNVQKKCAARAKFYLLNKLDLLMFLAVFVVAAS